MCLGFRLPQWEPGRTALWHPAYPHLDIQEEGYEDLCDLFIWIEQDGGLVEAHNAFFERGIWTNICVPKMGWPVVGHKQWLCSAAKAASHSLPRHLKDAAEALDLDIRKDEEGSAVMKKVSKPRKPNKADWQAWARQHAPCAMCQGTGRVPKWKKDTTLAKKGQRCPECDGYGARRGVELPDMPILWHESKELFERLWRYCRIDVLAEEGVSHALPDLSPDEQEMYWLDQGINVRGFGIDTDAVACALDLVDEEFADLNTELAALTQGDVTKASQRAKMMRWLATEGCELDDTTADTVAETLERPDLTPPARRGLEIMATLGKSSTAKYTAMQSWVCPDGRVHGGLLYHGASTGRWTGAGVQPHNFPRGEVKDDPDMLWAFLATKDRELIAREYGSVMTALSSGLRGAIIPSKGKQFYVADFNAIESRVLLWHAGDEAGLDIFRQNRDIYNEMASSIYGYPVNRKLPEHKTQGMLGKVAILGLGYQMGAAKFVDTALTMGGVAIAEDVFCLSCGEGTKAHARWDNECTKWTPDKDPDTMTSVKVVDAYRAKFHRVTALWKAQNDAAMCAVKTRRPTPCGHVTWSMSADNQFLYCELPSGRRLAYPGANVRKTTTSWGKVVDELGYMGISQFTRRWQRQKAYGGLLVENIVQATARDLLAEAMVRSEAAGYQVVLTIHDEIMAERETGNVHEFEQVMAATPEWARSCPIKADGWTGSRYRKG